MLICSGRGVNPYSTSDFIKSMLAEVQFEPGLV